MLNEDLIFIRAWCIQWCMQLNPVKTKSIIFSRSRTVNPEHPDLNLDNVAIENVKVLKLLGVLFDSKLTFESHLRSVTSAVSQKIGILRKCWVTYRDNAVIRKCFYSFLLPFFEYCAVVWMSAAPTHLNLLQRAFTSANFLVPVNIRLEHRRDIAALCILFRIFNNSEHPMHSRLPGPVDPVRRTRRAVQMNSCALITPWSRYSSQYNRTFLPYTIEIWNFLPQEIVESRTIDRFKCSVNRHMLL